MRLFPDAAAVLHGELCQLVIALVLPGLTEAEYIKIKITFAFSSSFFIHLLLNAQAIIVHNFFSPSAVTLDYSFRSVLLLDMASMLFRSKTVWFADCRWRLSLCGSLLQIVCGCAKVDGVCWDEQKKKVTALWLFCKIKFYLQTKLKTFFTWMSPRLLLLLCSLASLSETDIRQSTVYDWLARAQHSLITPIILLLSLYLLVHNSLKKPQ